jgi:hypothetical protein
MGWGEAHEPDERPIPWHLTAKAVAYLRDRDHGLEPLARHNADELQAYVRDFLDRFEMVVADPRIVFHGLVFLCLIAECAQNGHQRGAFDEDEAIAVVALTRLVGSALVAHAPAEARR